MSIPLPTGRHWTGHFMRNGDNVMPEEGTGIYLYLDAVCCYACGHHAGCCRDSLAHGNETGKGVGTVVRR